MKSYYEILKELREDRDLSQQNIADLLQTDRSYYGKYERGIRPLPIEHLKKLAVFYGVSADYILGLPKGIDYPER